MYRMWCFNLGKSFGSRFIRSPQLIQGFSDCCLVCLSEGLRQNSRMDLTRVDGVDFCWELGFFLLNPFLKHLEMWHFSPVFLLFQNIMHEFKWRLGRGAVRGLLPMPIYVRSCATVCMSLNTSESVSLSLSLCVCVCVCVHVCVDVLLNAYSVLPCSCTGTPEVSALMEAGAVAAVLIAQTRRLLFWRVTNSKPLR